MKKYLKNIVFVVVCLIVICFLCAKIKNLESNTTELNNSVNVLTDRFILHSDFSGFYRFQPDYCMLSIKTDTVLIGDLVNKKSLILFISHDQCNSCVEFHLKELFYRNKVFNDDNTFKVFVFADYDIQELRALAINQNTDVGFYKITSSSNFFKNLTKAKLPFYFILNEQLEVSNIFFPSKNSYLLLNDKYFSHIHDFFSQK